METQRFTSGPGRNPKLTRKHFQTDFKVLHSFSLEMGTREEIRLTGQQTQLEGEEVVARDREDLPVQSLWGSSSGQRDGGQATWRACHRPQKKKMPSCQGGQKV